MSHIALRSWSQINSAARFLLNDISALTYTDGSLVEPDAMALGELESVFENQGIPFSDKIAMGLPLAAGGTSISVSATIYTVTKMYQKVSTGDTYIEVTPADTLPPLPPSPPGYLSEWAWQCGPITSGVGTIVFNPAAQDLIIAYKYQAASDYPGGATVAGSDDVYWCAIYKVAQLAAEATGRNGAMFEAKYMKRVDMALSRMVRERQKVVRRPRAYSSTR